MGYRFIPPRGSVPKFIFYFKKVKSKEGGIFFLGVDAFYEADLSPLMHINVIQAGVYKVRRVMYMSGPPPGSKPLKMYSRMQSRFSSACLNFF